MGGWHGRSGYLADRGPDYTICKWEMCVGYRSVEVWANGPGGARRQSPHRGPRSLLANSGEAEQLAIGKVRRECGWAAGCGKSVRRHGWAGRALGRCGEGVWLAARKV